MSNEAGIFRELKEIANQYLLDRDWKLAKTENRSFGHKTNCIELSGNSAPAFFNAGEMIDKMFDRIKSNISNRVPAVKGGRMESSTPSQANWNFAFRTNHKPEAAENSTKPEVTLERAIIQARRKIADLAWTYQMPVATGLFGRNIDKSSNIDLVRRRAEYEFELIELKIGSNNPLYAAVEILQYGLAYAATRNLAPTIGYHENTLEILAAKKIELCVLAPKLFYEPPKTDKYNFAWLENALNDALNIKFSSNKDGFCMTFKFCLLDLNWKATGRPTSKTLSDINKAIDNIGPVRWDTLENA